MKKTVALLAVLSFFWAVPAAASGKVTVSVTPHTVVYDVAGQDVATAAVSGLAPNTTYAGIVYSTKITGPGKTSRIEITGAAGLTSDSSGRGAVSFTLLTDPAFGACASQTNVYQGSATVDVLPATTDSQGNVVVTSDRAVGSGGFTLACP